jgi:iron(III) transport system permease protein
MTIDRSLEEASENLGARSVKTFFSVTLPMVMPSVTGGALIVFMMSLSNFGTPMIIGGNYLVLPTLAYNLYTSEISQTPGMASTVSIILSSALVASCCSSGSLRAQIRQHVGEHAESQTA